MDRDINFDMLEELFEIDDDLIGENSDTVGDIAIVGLAVKAGQADNAEELWQALCNAEELTAQMPQARAEDADAFARYLGKNETQYIAQSYLKQIDQFSPSFFHIPPKDAALIDPAQRLFLLTAFRALEDAGLSKKTLANSQTGVFVGYTSNPNSYSELLAESDPEFGDRAIAGKVNSIIAGRISYYLDLKGPAVMIDTACSSSLVAVHMACNSIRNGECDMAIAGSVKYTLLPLKTDDQGEISVTSANGQTRTFDINSDGTNPGEGVGAIVLKPLSKAIEDKDHIYALIKGSAINQDGASVGITAPNAAAQEAVIVKAWENAGIDPERVSYIEAHGTATKLGDPVEISGIERAFARFTDKKQFCAIGSVKTNLGHLDCAAGIIGLIKCVLALEHKQLPPQLHFTSPNKEIDFIHSPVYINDTLAPWESEGQRICGVSSFGLSGTNCHVILQEYADERVETAQLPLILPLSAKKKSELIQVARRFTEDALKTPEKLSDLIFTAAMARSDYEERFAIVVESIEDVKNLAERVETESAKLPQKNDVELLIAAIGDGKNISAMQALCEAYMQGAEVDWRRLFEHMPVRIVPTQGYPMQLERCWQVPKKRANPVYRSQQEPLIDVCITASPLVHIYSTSMSEQTHSEVREHIIGERNVLAGTVYVEMLRSAASKMLKSEHLQIDNLVFLAAMIFEKEMTREVQTILYQKGTNECEATIQSRCEGEDWTIHVQAKISAFEEESPEIIDVELLLSAMGENVLDETATTVDQMVTTGPRWKVQKGIWIADGEAVTMAEQSEEFSHELKQYHLYPSMLDAAVNCSSVLNGDTFCLPYYYGSMRIYRRMPQRIYSHTVKNRLSSSRDGEINVFDITIFDEKGAIIATVKDYAMKKAGERQKKQFYAMTEPLLRTLTWVKDQTKYRPSALVKADESLVLVSYNETYGKKLYQAIKAESKGNLYELVLCDWEGRHTDRKRYVYADEQTAIAEYFEDMENRELSRIVFLLPDESELKSSDVLQGLLRGFFNIIYAVASNKALGNVCVDILIPANGEASPTAMALIGMGKSVLFEYSRLRLRSVLYTGNTHERYVLDELSYNHSDYMIRLDGEMRCLPQIVETDGAKAQPFSLKENGTYLITGGLGGVGFVIAQELARLEPSIRLVLTGRRNIDDVNDERCAKLRSMAASVRYFACDASNAEAFAEVFESVGAVNGIVHAAGLPGGGFVIKRQWEDFFEVLKPKIFGTMNLVELAKREETDFLVLFSSYASVLAVAGQSDYICANSFIDACAQLDKVKVINWGGWKECGMALDNGVDMVHSPVQFMTNAEGAQAFCEAMACSERQVLAGKFNYPELAESLQDYQKVVRFSDDDLLMLRSSEQKKNAEKNYDITVHGKDTPLTATEQKIAQAWAKILGLREVDYQDKFLEVGGDSMSATYLQKEIDSIYPNVMDITDVFVYPTIEQMAAFVDSKTVIEEIKQPVRATDTDQMRKLLEQLAAGEIDVSKAGRLI